MNLTETPEFQAAVSACGEEWPTVFPETVREFLLTALPHFERLFAQRFAAELREYARKEQVGNRYIDARVWSEAADFLEQGSNR